MITSRMGDLGIGFCPIHSTVTAGIIVGGAYTKMSDNMPSARSTDLLICCCGCTSMIITGSPTSFDENLSTARAGDIISAPVTGVLISGSGIHLTG